MALKRRKTAKKTTRTRPAHRATEMPLLRGITFDLCCGKYQVMSGIREDRGRFRVDMEAHGFALTLVLSEEQAASLGRDLTGSVIEAAKGVN
jgi:hypothetical protein